MQRRQVANSPDEHVEMVNLLHTAVRDEYKKPPPAERIKDFIRHNYTLPHLVPSTKWMPAYLGSSKNGWRENFYGDVFAACTTAAFLVPQGMSYALIANLDPIYGLYCATFPLIVYGLLGTSRQLAMGPVAIVSLILGHGLHELEEPKLADGSQNPEYVKLAIAASFFAGILQLFMGLFKMGFVTRLLSHPVLSGFTSAAALIIGFGQVKHVLGFSPKSSDNLFLLVADILTRIGKEAHWPSLVMGIGVIIIMFTFKNIPQLKKLPSAMIVVVVGILVSWGMNLGETHGFKIAGTVPGGIPAPSLPSFPQQEQVGPLLTLVLVLSLIGYMESIAVGMVYASKNGYETVPDQELVAIGLANVVGSLFSAYPTAGGFGRTAVNANAGSKTPLAGMISGLLMLIVLTWLTPLFYHLPKPVLGAIVIVAVTGLLDTAEPKRLWKTEAYDDLMSLVVTFFATCVVGVETGVGIGVGLSLFVLIARAAAPNYVVLGHVAGTTAYHDIKIMEVAKPVAQHVIVRFDADLWFANCLAFKEAVFRELRSADLHGGAIRRLVLDFSGVNYVDSSAMHALHEVVHELHREHPNLEIAIAGAKRVCRKILMKELKIVNCAQMHQLSSANLRNVQTRMGDEASADLGMAMDSGHGVGVIVSSDEAMLAQLFERFKCQNSGKIREDVAMYVINELKIGVEPSNIQLSYPGSTTVCDASSDDPEVGKVTLGYAGFKDLARASVLSTDELLHDSTSIHGESPDATFYSNVHEAVNAPLGCLPSRPEEGVEVEPAGVLTV